MNSRKVLSILASMACLGGIALAASKSTASCHKPANLATGPFTFFTIQSSCSGGGHAGAARGLAASGGLPRRICANHLFGNNSTSSQGYTGESGGMVVGCKAHDSTVGNGEFCDTTGCAAAQFHDLVSG